MSLRVALRLILIALMFPLRVALILSLRVVLMLMLGIVVLLWRIALMLNLITPVLRIGRAAFLAIFNFLAIFKALL